MEYFYRLLRRQTGLLMDGDQPVGGRWNFDKNNRKALPKDLIAPVRPQFEVDAITQEVLGLVAAEFAGNFGDMQSFNWPVTHAQALGILDQFIDTCLPLFGDFQDAMRRGRRPADNTLFHSLLDPVEPRPLRGQRGLRSGSGHLLQRPCPINAVEGFIRQILG